MITDRMWSQGDVAMRGTMTAFRRWFCHELLEYELVTPGSPITNENAVAIKLERAGAPEGFRAVELDTGYNSKYRPGARSQTIISYMPQVEVRFSKCSADTRPARTGKEDLAAYVDLAFLSNIAKQLKLALF